MDRIDRRLHGWSQIGMNDFAAEARKEAVELARERALGREDIAGSVIFVIDPRGDRGRRIMIDILVGDGHTRQDAGLLAFEANNAASTGNTPIIFSSWITAGSLRTMLDHVNTPDGLHGWLDTPIPVGFLRMLMIDDIGKLTFETLPYASQ